MRKLRLVKVVVPDIVAYMGEGPGFENMEPEYRCPVCGYGVADDYVCCPCCAAELDWENVRTPTKEFRELLNRLCIGGRSRSW